MEPKVVSDLIFALNSCGGKEIFLNENARNFCENHDEFEIFNFEQKVDLIFSLGGDGRILKTVRNLKYFSTAIFGINAGHLGFLSEIPPTDLPRVCGELFAGKFSVDSRMLLRAEVFRAGKVISEFRVLNEVVVGQSSVARLADLPVKIDGAPIANFRADGLICATPTGSTAHSLSAGGPILHPKTEAIILTPIAPHAFSQKPIVLPPEKKIKIEPKHENREEIVLTADGQIFEKLEPGDEIQISKFDQKVKFLRLESESFFETLRSKLGWGERFCGKG